MEHSQVCGWQYRTGKVNPTAQLHLEHINPTTISHSPVFADGLIVSISGLFNVPRISGLTKN